MVASRVRLGLDGPPVALASAAVRLGAATVIGVADTLMLLLGSWSGIVWLGSTTATRL